MSNLLLIILLIILFGGFGTHAYNSWGANYGYGFGGLGSVLILIVVLRMVGII